MAGATKQQAHPPKKFCVPADMAPLNNYAVTLINAMRQTYQWRMKDGARSIGSGRKK